ncbi:unnamed protein product [Camellia sinensis]
MWHHRKRSSPSISHQLLKWECNWLVSICQVWQRIYKYLISYNNQNVSASVINKFSLRFYVMQKTFPNKWSIIGGAKKEKKKATDAPYSKWQCQIMYYWYKKVKAMSGSDMGGFTRVLHSGNPDNLMEEIPTFVVDPFPDGLDWLVSSERK